MGLFRKKSKSSNQKTILSRANQRLKRRGKIYRLTPPEGVPLDLALATTGQRVMAQFTDFVTTFALAILIVMLAFYSFHWFSSLFTVIASLAFFIIRIPYYIFTELAWDGRTLAKRWYGIRVISADGRALSPHQIVIRNLMKEIEFFAPLTYLFVGSQIHWSIYIITLIWVVILLLVPWRSKKNQRIGDIIANTVVIMNPKPLLLPDIALNAPDQERFVFTSEQLDLYGNFELQVLEKILRAPVAKSTSALRKEFAMHADIVERITTKISYPEKILQADQVEFLKSFYQAQRAYLENKKLFGESRGDKFFKDDIPKV